ncbi:MAG: hypothetical protein P8Z77_06055 [Candidatus Thiodiazotropha sp.]
MPDNDKKLARLAADAAVCTGLLGIGRTIALISGALLLVTTSIWIWGHSIHSNVFFSSAALALLQGYFAQRVRFDAVIFNIWATRWKGTADPGEDLKAFDRRIGRSTSAAVSVQADLEERTHGALQLLRYQALSGLLQLMLTVIALWP